MQTVAFIFVVEPKQTKKVAWTESHNTIPAKWGTGPGERPWTYKEKGSVSERDGKCCE